MHISTILREIRHFYFNYPHLDSSSSWIYRLLTPQVQFALKMTIAFIVGGFLAYGTPLNNTLSIEFFIPKMSIICMQETFGLTLLTCYHMLLTLVPLSIFLFIAQKIGLGYHDYLATELLLLITSFYMAYACSQVQHRKITLFFIVVYFSSIVNQTSMPSTFSFDLLEKYVIGMGVALLVSLLIFPLFATLDIENRVDYCLLNLQQMQTLIIESFLCKDIMDAQMPLSRALTIEQMIRKTMNLIHVRLNEARFEPSRCLQQIFNRRQKDIIDLKLQEKEDLIVSLMFHVSSLELIITQSQFNEYHNGMTRDLRSSLLSFNSCQSVVIASLVSSSSISKDDFTRQLSDLDQAGQTLHLSYTEARFHRVEDAHASSSTIRSDDHFSHAFFLFQLSAILRLLTNATRTDLVNKNSQEKKKKKSLKNRLTPEWLRLFSALKGMIIIGVGSIFVLVPSLATAFNNGQWILISLCMTQGDTVGGVFTNIKMRLMGTLLGIMWAYVTYLLVHDNNYEIIGVLVPWMLIFGYLRLSPDWGFAALLAAFTTILNTFGRVPYEQTLPGDKYILLRIEEYLIGIAIGIVLTLIIFPISAIDQLKDNIQTILQLSHKSVSAMHLIYDHLFYLEHSNEVSINVDVQKKEIKSFFSSHRCHLQLLINTQQSLVRDATIEPTFWWSNKIFSGTWYNKLVQQEMDMFKMLHNIDATLICINECSIKNKKQIEDLQMNGSNDYFLPNLHTGLLNLNKQLKDCLNLWSSYFFLTQTRFHRLFRHCIYSQEKLVEDDLLKHEQCIIELRQIANHLEDQHEEVSNQILKHSFSQLKQDETSFTFAPIANNDQADLIFIALSAMHYSTTQLARVALALSTSIHTILELETTQYFQAF